MRCLSLISGWGCRLPPSLGNLINEGRAILDLLKAPRHKYKRSIILITHDIDVVVNIADRVALMYAGDIIEIGCGSLRIELR